MLNKNEYKYIGNIIKVCPFNRVFLYTLYLVRPNEEHVIIVIWTFYIYVDLAIP